jgi:hypothetical protein
MGLPTQYSQFNKDGDPHWNSTINTYAAYLLSEGTADGQPVNGVTVTGIGRFKAQYIYYNVMTQRLKIWVNFSETRKAALAACNKLAGSHGITPADCRQVMNAYAAVGIGEPAPQPSAPDLSILQPLLTLLDRARQGLRLRVDEALGKWSPLKAVERVRAEIERIRNNYWVQLLECMKNSDQACVDRYAADLVNAVLEMVVTTLCNFCASLWILPPLVVAIRRRRKRTNGQVLSGRVAASEPIGPLPASSTRPGVSGLEMEPAAQSGRPFRYRIQAVR